MTRFLLPLLFVLGCGSDPEAPSWQVLATAYPASLLGVWGSDPDNVWIVGSDARDLGDGLGPAVLHYDGEKWDRLDTGLRRIDLWWVFGFEGGPIFMGGSNGTVLRYEGGTFEKLTTPGNSFVFGIWGSSPTDLWVVGGQFGANGFVWRFDGTTFTPMTLPPDLATNAVWKVSGRSANDVWISCNLGAVLQWNGQELVRHDVGSKEESMFSIATNSKLVVTVGGNFSSGLLYEYDGTTWKPGMVASGQPPWRGVSANGEQVYAVGQEAHVARRTGSSWSEEIADGAENAFHANWVDPDGSLWAVGGKFDRIPPIDGMILYKGPKSKAPPSAY